MSPSTNKLGSLIWTIGAPPTLPSSRTPSTGKSTFVIETKISFSSVTRFPTAAAVTVVTLLAVMAARNKLANWIAGVPAPYAICTAVGSDGGIGGSTTGDLSNSNDCEATPSFIVIIVLSFNTTPFAKKSITFPVSNWNTLSLSSISASGSNTQKNPSFIV